MRNQTNEQDLEGRTESLPQGRMKIADPKLIGAHAGVDYTAVPKPHYVPKEPPYKPKK